jgi:hypothetical protein
VVVIKVKNAKGEIRRVDHTMAAKSRREKQTNNGLQNITQKTIILSNFPTIR